MATPDHITVGATWSAGRLAFTPDQQEAFVRGLRRLKLGDGEVVSCRFEREEEAWRYSDLKHLYGHLYKPVSARTGETVAEVHVRMKVDFMPDDGRTSITQLNREEMRSFIESVEQDIRENDPDSWEDCVAAMTLYERSKSA